MDMDIEQRRTTSQLNVTTLPFDILAQIFLACLPDDPGDDFPTFSAKAAPLLLGRVCSCWREVALTTPRVWAKLSIRKADEHGNVLTRKPVSAVQAWIRRTGRCALSFRFVTDDFSRTEEKQILISILPHRERWEYLEVHGSLSVYHICAAISNGAPLLRYLNISSFHCFATENLDLSTTPILQTLIVDTAHKIRGPGTCARTLRHISVHVESLDECWSYLAHCPNIEIFEAVTSRKVRVARFTSFEPDVDILQLTRLHTMRLNVPYAGPLLNRLLLPVLRSFHFGTSDPGTNVLSFLHRLEHPLERLVIGPGATEFGPNDLLDYLRRNPALVSLSVLGRRSLSDAQIRQLQLGLEPDLNLCPHLERIEFGDCVGCSMLRMEEMVLSRWRGANKVVASASPNWTSVQNDQWERNLRYHHLQQLQICRILSGRVYPFQRAARDREVH
ncbi:hypothetical protein BD410DRAFT_794331 [Rickenella mellea]|uniref:Uncharacterized protein n=1 Tax=Rickenella mellea TaxID=50990 RepID=A0A4Y7PQS5_9AGAM|nr:hypothetical protein BD410DRAFT_794331 [Rickenella mellea]